MKISQVNYMDKGPVAVKYDKILFDAEGNEVVVGKHTHRFVPGDDISVLSQEYQDAINLHWTTERVTAYQTSQADAEARDDAE